VWYGWTGVLEGESGTVGRIDVAAVGELVAWHVEGLKFFEW
jgi:hypothetical protein